MPASDANRLTETSVELITDHIVANIATSLSDMRSLRTDNIVTTEPPKSYFIHIEDKGYRLPAVFVLSSGMDFRLDTGPNYINGIENMMVAVIVEARNRRLLTFRGWRYQAALVKILDQTHLDATDGSVRIICKVTKTSFSEITEAGDTTSSPENQKMYRQETIVEMEVEHYEQF